MITAQQLSLLKRGALQSIDDAPSSCSLWWSDSRQQFIITGYGNSFAIPASIGEVGRINRHVNAFVRG